MIHRTRTLGKTHVTVVITNGKGERGIIQGIKKALIRIKRLFGISFVITEVDFQE